MPPQSHLPGVDVMNFTWLCAEKLSLAGIKMPNLDEIS